MSEFSTAFDHLGELGPEALLPPAPNFQLVLDKAEIAAKFDQPERVSFCGVAKHPRGQVAILFHDPQLPPLRFVDPMPAVRRAPLAKKVQSIDERFISPRG